jgi:hypothetical protein
LKSRGAAQWESAGPCPKMPEPLTIITGVSTLLSNAVKLLKDVQSTVSAVKNAPAHITAICNDLEDFYSVLGTLQIIDRRMVLFRTTATDVLDQPPKRAWALRFRFHKPSNHCQWLSESWKIGRTRKMEALQLDPSRDGG